MGCTAAKAVAPGESYLIDEKSSANPRWKLKRSLSETKRVFEKEGTVPKNCSSALLELRAFMDDPILLCKLGVYAKSKNALDLLLCFTDVLEYTKIDDVSNDYRLSKASIVYQKYIKKDSIVKLGDELVSVEFQQECFEQIQLATNTSRTLPDDLFNAFLQKVLITIYDRIFVDFKKCPEFAATTAELREQYNQVGPDDFEYTAELGRGAFGIVVHCKKKSTGKHYAMKIQTKLGLLANYAPDYSGVSIEKEALAACIHPFIISMHYAFQTTNMVMIVMDLGTGTLAELLKVSPGYRLSEESVRFYSAEILLALFHIHRMGLIYRDLKPSNVIVTSDGHVQLVDLGGIVDVGGNVLGKSGVSQGSSSNLSGLFSSPNRDHFPADLGSSNLQLFPTGSNSRPHSPKSGSFSYSRGNKVRRASSNHSVALGSGCRTPIASIPRRKPLVEADNDTTQEPMRRARSIMGTCGYIAPEMLILSSSYGDKGGAGYTKGVDFWSLGVVMYKLLSGLLPFKQTHVADFVDYLTNLKMNDNPGLPLGPFEATIPSASFDNVMPSQDDLLASKARSMNSFMEFLTVSKQSSTDFAMTNGACSPLRNFHPAYKDFLNLSEARGISSNSIGIIRAFLEVDETRRLGSGPNGVKNIKSHCYFNNILWGSLMQKHLVPPPCTLGSQLQAASYGSETFNSLDDFLEKAEKLQWQSGNPEESEQKHFKHWDFISPSVIKLEMGMTQHEIEKVDASFKAFISSSSSLANMDDVLSASNPAPRTAFSPNGEMVISPSSTGKLAGGTLQSLLKEHSRSALH